MSYTQVPSALAMVGRSSELTNRVIEEWNTQCNGEMLAVNTLIALLQRGIIFRFNDDCSITVESNALCAPNADAFSRKMNETITGSYKHTQNEPPFAYSQIKYTCDCKGDVTINEAECAYRY
jgi:hypothetical protein